MKDVIFEGFFSRKENKKGGKERAKMGYCKLYSRNVFRIEKEMA